ncbi:MAG: L,D-transpeptidase [Lewinellaceae bacterium]|nr:L,D-transpeptidase [Lewinellaceae bacterium]
MLDWHKGKILAIALAVLLCAGCKRKATTPDIPPAKTDDTPAAVVDTIPVRRPLFEYTVPREVRIRDYFRFLDSLVLRYDSLVPYHLTEHLLVRANPWLIDTLAGTDYYHRLERGEFVYDQRKLVVLRPGDTLRIPDTLTAREIQRQIDSTWLDLNIPEFRLRIVEGADTVHSILVRVGKNQKRYQELLKRKEDLRTRPGTGAIIRINRTPSLFVDPHTGRKLIDTKRDDRRKTRMPMIPWIEPEINGRRLGQLIHPTTNPSTLGKASSNGCIGCSEADAWRLYYHAPLGTRIVIRYDLNVPLPDGDTLRLRDIYGWEKGVKF